MSATASQILGDLRRAGLRISAAADGRLLASPGAAVTPEQEALIRANKTALLDVLAAEELQVAAIHARVRAMAERWRYAEDDLAHVLEASRADPAGWEIVCSDDEVRADRARRAGMRYPA